MSGNKTAFIEAIAEYLAGDQARKSIELQMGKESAKEWAKIRATTPLFGYPTVEEAKAVLLEWFFPIN